MIRRIAQNQSGNDSKNLAERKYTPRRQFHRFINILARHLCTDSLKNWEIFKSSIFLGRYSIYLKLLNNIFIIPHYITLILNRYTKKLNSDKS